MKKKYLIVGGTGFLGHHLTLRLLKNKINQISCIYNSNKKIKKLKNVTYIKCDISKKEQVKKLDTNYDFIINFAGYVDHSNKVKTINSHYYGCKKIANHFVKKKLKLFLQIGSSLEYANTRCPHKETNIVNISDMKSYYSKSKLMATNYLKKISNEKNLNVCVVRPYLIYGPGQAFNRLVPIVMKAAIKKETFDCSNGIQIRDLLYISDFINLIIKILNKNNKSKFEIYNAGSGKGNSIKNIVKKIVSIAKGGKPKFGVIKSRPDESKKSIASMSKVMKQLKWSPKISLDLGLRKTYKFYYQICQTK